MTGEQKFGLIYWGCAGVAFSIWGLYGYINNQLKERGVPTKYRVILTKYGNYYVQYRGFLGVWKDLNQFTRFQTYAEAMGATERDKNERIRNRLKPSIVNEFT